VRHYTTRRKASGIRTHLQHHHCCWCCNHRSSGLPTPLHMAMKRYQPNRQRDRQTDKRPYMSRLLPDCTTGMKEWGLEGCRVSPDSTKPSASRNI